MISIGSFAARLARGVAPLPARALLLTLVLAFFSTPAHAADKWIEIKSPNVTVMTAGGAGSARTLAWQLEQIRSAVVAILPWAQVELDRPFLVVAVDSELKMRQIVPQFWERGGSVRPASVWVSGIDRHYLAIRTDIVAEDDSYSNPHRSAYFSYVAMVLQRSLPAEMPFWFRRGLAAVLSNTIVRESHLLVGTPIPQNLVYLRERVRLKLPALVDMQAGAPELKQHGGLERYDAQAWAFVHFLMFGNSGARAPKINEFFRMVTSGTAPAAAMAETIGNVDQLEADFVMYVNRSIFSFSKMTADVSVKRDGFVQRPLTTGESSSALALFHTSMRRPVEARAAIAEARTADAAAPDSHLAEGIQLERDGKREEARAALARAVAGGSTNAYAHYTLSRLNWQPRPDAAGLKEQETLLARAVELNPRYAYALARLGEIRAMSGAADALSLVIKAVRLDPNESDHRLTAARILLRSGQHGEALKLAQVALTLATTEEERARVREFQQAIERDKAR